MAEGTCYGLEPSHQSDPHATGFDDQHLLGELNLAQYRIMNMSGNQIAAGAVHLAHLLGEVAGGEELDTFGLVTGSK